MPSILNGSILFNAYLTDRKETALVTRLMGYAGVSPARWDNNAGSRITRKQPRAFLIRRGLSKLTARWIKEEKNIARVRESQTGTY